eukprot:GHVU01167599.1.p1 GENE.GHVU01167599.1~~GHVU01167599.1.p1  ORF type:complete len:112 (-),score=25.74 GHVU01167599.1:94-429(-)
MRIAVCSDSTSSWHRETGRGGDRGGGGGATIGAHNATNGNGNGSSSSWATIGFGWLGDTIKKRLTTSNDRSASGGGGAVSGQHQERPLVGRPNRLYYDQQRQEWRMQGANK